MTTEREEYKKLVAALRELRTQMKPMDQEDAPDMELYGDGIAQIQSIEDQIAKQRESLIESLSKQYQTSTSIKPDFSSWGYLSLKALMDLNEGRKTPIKLASIHEKVECKQRVLKHLKKDTERYKSEYQEYINLLQVQFALDTDYSYVLARMKKDCNKYNRALLDEIAKEKVAYEEHCKESEAKDTEIELDNEFRPKGDSVKKLAEIKQKFSLFKLKESGLDLEDINEDLRDLGEKVADIKTEDINKQMGDLKARISICEGNLMRLELIQLAENHENIQTYMMGLQDEELKEKWKWDKEKETKEQFAQNKAEEALREYNGFKRKYRLYRGINIKAKIQQEIKNETDKKNKLEKDLKKNEDKLNKKDELENAKKLLGEYKNIIIKAQQQLEDKGIVRRRNIIVRGVLGSIKEVGRNFVKPINENMSRDELAVLEWQHFFTSKYANNRDREAISKFGMPTLDALRRLSEVEKKRIKFEDVDKTVEKLNLELEKLKSRLTELETQRDRRDVDWIQRRPGVQGKIKKVTKEISEKQQKLNDYMQLQFALGIDIDYALAVVKKGKTDKEKEVLDAIKESETGQYKDQMKRFERMCGNPRDFRFSDDEGAVEIEAQKLLGELQQLTMFALKKENLSEKKLNKKISDIKSKIKGLRSKNAKLAKQLDKLEKSLRYSPIELTAWDEKDTRYETQPLNKNPESDEKLNKIAENRNQIRILQEELVKYEALKEKFSQQRDEISNRNKLTDNRREPEASPGRYTRAADLRFGNDEERQSLLRNRDSGRE